MIENQIAVLLESSMSLLPFNDLSKRKAVVFEDFKDVYDLRDQLTFKFPVAQRGPALMAAHNWASRPGERRRSLVLSQYAYRSPEMQRVAKVSGPRNPNSVQANLNFIWGCRDRDIMLVGYTRDEIASIIQSQEMIRVGFPANNGHRILFVSRD